MSAWRPHGRARVSALDPRSFAICDRCGFLGNLQDLQWQHQWQGASLVNLKLLVCEPCLDKPQQQLRSLNLPPDPVPVYNARPEYYAIDDSNWLVTQAGQILTTQSGLRLITQAVTPDT